MKLVVWSLRTVVLFFLQALIKQIDIDFSRIP